MTEVLPSWNNTATKAAIVDFVTRVTHVGGSDYVAPPERIATFDNDGTLWCEFPLQVQVFFTLDELKRLTVTAPALLAKPAFKALLAGDLKTLMTLSKREIFEPAFAVHAGMTVDEFKATVGHWLQQAKHPKLGRLFASNTYQPQVELLQYLRDNGFKTFIVTGGGIEFVREVSEQLYGIPPEQVVGSSTKAKFEIADGQSAIRKMPDLGSFDDRDEKPVNIDLHIGRRPIFAFGNSDGDLAMLRYTLTGPGARMGLLLHHDDAEHEFAYDRDFKPSPFKDGLDHADEYGIRIVSMKNDWNRVFPD
ncbi:HAD family hydrolase [Lysobacter cavernae]|uniref:HAD family hydrolase n=1 Tax=Lysobacter cavernae TaxID=1685901 RepID=A0ABV7RIT6_9GAMM